MKYNLTFGRNAQLIWALILPAFIGLIPLMLILEWSQTYYPEEDWIFLTATLLYLAADIYVTLKWVKAIRVPVEITIEKERLNFTFPKKNLFHRHDFALSISNIANTSEDNDKEYDFIYLETRNTPIPGFHLMARETDPNFLEFKNNLYQLINDFKGEVSGEEEIKHISIYQKWPMKLFAVLILAMWISFPILFYFNEMNALINLKYWAMVLVSSPVLLKVYLWNFKKKQA